jgi:hypothetical protein
MAAASGRSSLVKSLVSAVAIGTGAAVGREGPIIQIGSAIGSALGQFIAMSAGQRITLVAAGAGAGIAATFNMPIGGVLFAIEPMMPEVSATSFLPAAIATGTATFVGRLFFGSQPAFAVPPIAPLLVNATTPLVLVLYAALGVIVGVAATGFIRGLHLFEDLFDRIKNRYLRHVLGMLLVGVLIYGLFRGFGHCYVEGVAYATIRSILLGQMPAAWLLLLLFTCKLLATSLSLGSGSSGGIFSPSLFIGGDAWRRLREPARAAAAADAGRCPKLCPRRHGRDGRRRHRRGDDGGCDDLRNDPRLRHRRADDHRGRLRGRHPPGIVAREHLHDETLPARPRRAESAARQHVPGAPGARGHG